MNEEEEKKKKKKQHVNEYISMVILYSDISGSFDRNAAKYMKAIQMA